MNPSAQNCVFGPIPSRRLGISLGIDLIPFKTCPMDCIYCECGKTTDLTGERKEYFPIGLALSQIDGALEKRPDIDYITFSGTGEPTLHSGIGTIIAHIRKKYPAVRICLITNSFFLSDPALRKELDGLDLIIPSLDGSNAEELQVMNRLLPIDFRTLVRGIADFKKESSAKMNLEIFLAHGINDSEESAERFAALVREIQPDKVQLNTLDRPGTEHDVQIPPPEVLEFFRRRLSRELSEVECIGGRAVNRDRSGAESVSECREHILTTIASRPCTAEDLSLTLKMPLASVEFQLRQMEKENLIVPEEGPRGIYFREIK